MKLKRSNRFAVIAVVVLMSFGMTNAQDRTQMFAALSVEASNCMTRIQSELFLLANRRDWLWRSYFPALKNIKEEKIQHERVSGIFSSMLSYEGDVKLEKWVPSPSGIMTTKGMPGDGYIHSPNPSGLILTVGIWSERYVIHKTKSWSVVYELPKPSHLIGKELDIFYDMESGKAVESKIGEVKAVIEKHLTAYRDKAAKIVGEPK